tara:strand:+ start:65 stop:355 length:291 start_codon:yes stop_codon:yes gene_type:complete
VEAEEQPQKITLMNEMEDLAEGLVAEVHQVQQVQQVKETMEDLDRVDLTMELAEAAEELDRPAAGLHMTKEVQLEMVKAQPLQQVLVLEHQDQVVL